MKQIILLIITIWSISCTTTKDVLAEITYNVNPNTTQTVDMSVFVDSVSYIQLESTPKSRVSRISHIYKDDDQILIVSRNEILFFDLDGKFNHKINRQGRGRGEYLKLDAIDIDVNKNRIVVMDAATSKLLQYDYDGKLISQINEFSNNRKFVRDILLLPDEGYLCSEYTHGNIDKDPYELWRVDSDGNVTEELFVSEFAHPTISINWTLCRISSEKIAYVCVENNADYIFENNRFSKVLQYNIDGKTTSDFSGLTNVEFSKSHWMNNKNLVARSYALYDNNFTFSRWSTENLGETFYTLIDLKNNIFMEGAQIDPLLNNGQIIIASSAGKNITGKYKLYYEAIKDNIEGVIAMEVLPETIDDENLLKQIGISKKEASNMNPIIQLLHIKK